MPALHPQTSRCQQHVHWSLNMWRNIMLNNESRLCLLQLDCRVKVWRRHAACYAHCCTASETAFVGGSVMVRCSITLTGKTRFVVICSNFKAERYRDEILQPEAISYLHSLGLNSVFQDDNAPADWVYHLPEVRTSSPLETCGISLGVHVMPE